MIVSIRFTNRIISFLATERSQNHATTSITARLRNLITKQRCCCCACVTSDRRASDKRDEFTPLVYQGEKSDLVRYQVITAYNRAGE
jgi:hypothetical protein